MKRETKKTLQGLLLVTVVAVVVYFMGPIMIHWGYRLGTSDEVRQSNKLRYLAMARAEMSAPEDDRVGMQAERMKLFYWFSARGWVIDGGDHEPYTPWQDLFRHWRGE